MKENKPNLLTAALEAAASAQKLGINLIRVAILIIFVWIGGLKFWNYEAEGIVPFVANSPFMNFFYTKSAPEYKQYKLKEGELDEAKHQWPVEQHVRLLARAGYSDHVDRHPDFPRHLLPEDRCGRRYAGHHYDDRHPVVPRHYA